MANSWESELHRTLEEYVQQVGDKADQIMEEAADEAASELKSTSPKDKGAYARSWTVKRVKFGRTTSFVVHNKKHYQLTHLLEHGHAKRNGGRVAARPHIKNAEQNGFRKVISRLEAEL